MMDADSVILVTGSAGFIGAAVARHLLEDGYKVVGLDNHNAYYDVNLKEARVNLLQNSNRYTHYRAELQDYPALVALFEKHRPTYVIHLAAQAGVRHSLTHPFDYVDSNLVGFVNMLECCRQGNIKHLVYASSSSVYGGNRKLPFSVQDRVDQPISLYAATKKANELMAHSYSHLYQLPTSGLRFFTVYGPWGRPDMAYFSFTQAILAGKPIKIYHHGKSRRDFTYIDDIVEGVIRLLFCSPQSADPSSAPYCLYNIGNHAPVDLLYFVEILEGLLGKSAIKEFLPAQPGDVAETYADIDDLTQAIGFEPSTPVEKGLSRFVDWYLSYYSL